jgi:hypothetical protein
VDPEITELGESKRFVRTEYEGYRDVFSTRSLHHIANSLKSRLDDEDILRKIDGYLSQTATAKGAGKRWIPVDRTNYQGVDDPVCLLWNALSR